LSHKLYVVIAGDENERNNFRCLSLFLKFRLI